MKTILSLVDFSDVSINSLSFAAELTKRASARLIIIHILKKNESEEDANNKLKSIESDLKKSFSNLNCETTLAYGELINTLKEIIAVQQPDLIVMGTNGASGLKRILIGSNTVNVIEKTRVPVLVIPAVARFSLLR